MIFRSITGEIIEIPQTKFKNDKLFYQNIMKMKMEMPFAKSINTSTTKKKSNYSSYAINAVIN